MGRRQITLGGLHESTHILSRLAFPVLAEINAMQYMSDCLFQAANERKGVALIGDKGSGKSIAIQPSIDEFIEAECLKEEADSTYQPRLVVQVPTMDAPNRRDALCDIYRAVTGSPPNLKLRGQRKTDKDIRDELIEHLLNLNIAVLVFDEAEKITREGLEAIRDLISCAESRSPARLANGHYVPAGVGVLAMGTSAFRARVETHDEAGHRWVRFQPVDNVDHGFVPELLPRFLPGLGPYVTEVGEAAWQRYVDENVTFGKNLPVRYFENLARSYARVYVAAFEVDRPEEIGFDEELFNLALTETARPGRRADDAAA